MTKRRVGVSSGHWFEGSQVSKARPGAPFDLTLRVLSSILQRAHALLFHSASLGMTKERVGVSSGTWFEGSFDIAEKQMLTFRLFSA
jgi:hypothetical protein